MYNVCAAKCISFNGVLFEFKGIGIISVPFSDVNQLVSRSFIMTHFLYTTRMICLNPPWSKPLSLTCGNFLDQVKLHLKLMKLQRAYTNAKAAKSSKFVILTIKKKVTFFSDLRLDEDPP